jgi:Mn-dependent DtxR family transcriptional regulator
MSRVAPPPSRAAERLREYLEILATAQEQRGKTLWYDVYRRAGNQYQTDQVILYLTDNGLVKGSKEEGYQLTIKGETWREILGKHSDLVGVLTRELSGERRKSF